jgi:Dolichyl-phosphate-mannose-protein mannosyltransferase
MSLKLTTRTMAKHNPRHDRRWMVPLFVLIVSVHALSEIKVPGDSAWVLHTAQSILSEGNTDLTEYGLVEGVDNQYTLVWVDGKPYNMFPLGPALWALPALALADGGMRVFSGRSYETVLQVQAATDMQELVASLAVATAALLLWSLLRALGLNRRRALILVLFFAFGTSAWSVASRALWPHGPSLVWLGTVLLCLVLAERRPGLLWLAGAALALAFVTRPTNALSVIGLTIYAVWRFRRQAWGLVVAGGIGAVLFAGHNLAVYGALLPPYFQPDRLTGSSTVLEALAGNLVSPGRGLLVYTPVLFFGFWGWKQWQRDDQWRPLVNALALIIIAHWIAISRFPHWWGGWCYGPRFFSDLLIYFMIMLVPVVRALEFRTRAGRMRTVAFAMTMVAGGVIHWAGANATGTMQWNAHPANIDQKSERVWDWKDPQFLRWQERSWDDVPLVP